MATAITLPELPKGIAPNKWYTHAIYGAAIVAVPFGIVAATGGSQGKALLLGLALAAVAGVGKEWRDMSTRKGVADKWDALFTIAGALLVYVPLKYLAA